MSRFGTTLAVTAVAVAGAAVSGAAADDGRHGGRTGDRGDHQRGHDGRRTAFAILRDAQGNRIGHVVLRERRRSGAVTVYARARGLAPGFHGFHVHTTGRCDAPAFTSAGGHFNPGGAPHGAHAGDLPSLLVTADGTAVLATVTDRFSLGDLRDADGSAVMVHSGPDNFANIPSRYGGPDAETLNTGDSGTRVACGVVR